MIKILLTIFLLIDLNMAYDCSDINAHYSGNLKNSVKAPLQDNDRSMSGQLY